MKKSFLFKALIILFLFPIFQCDEELIEKKSSILLGVTFTEPSYAILDLELGILGPFGPATNIVAHNVEMISTKQYPTIQWGSEKPIENSPTTMKVALNIDSTIVLTLNLGEIGLLNNRTIIMAENVEMTSEEQFPTVQLRNE